MPFPAAFREPTGPHASLLALSALEQAQAVRAGEVTSEALVDLYLERVGRLDPQLGAFVCVQAERAQDTARRRDKARTAGEPLSPFHGVPIAVKDLHMLRGAPMRMGSRAWRWLWSPVDDLTVRAVNKAGFVILGKTSTSEMALMPVVETDIHPPTRNPWDLSRTSGGSSGGAAAAVAAGLLPLSPGSDGGGSVRIPATTCGLVGLKPSRGAIPNPHAAMDRPGMTAIGPLARGVDDAAALADVLCGRDPGAPGSWLSAARQAPPPGLRVGVLTQSPLDLQTCPHRAQAARDAGEVLRARGDRVEARARIPGTLEEFLPIYQRLFADMPVLFESKLQPVTRWFRVEGRRYTQAQAREAFETLSRRALEAQAGLDVLLTPTCPIAPPRVGQFSHLEPVEMFRSLAPLGAFTAPWNVTGQPACTVPWGFDPDGLPMGVQLVGRLGDDARILALARVLQAAAPASA